MLSQQMYADELPLMDISEYLSPTGVTNSDELKSTSKQRSGALIWLRQTRPDIGFTITQMATQIAEAFGSSEKARKIAQMYNKIVKFFKNYQRKISYVRSPKPNRDVEMDSSQFLNWELFAFTDAGFGAQVKNRSAESHVVILGDVIERDGIIKCHCLM